MPHDLSHCTDPEGVRDLFYKKGELYQKLGIPIESHLLEGIKSGRNPASSIVDGRPNFK